MDELEDELLELLEELPTSPELEELEPKPPDEELEELLGFPLLIPEEAEELELVVLELEEELELLEELLLLEELDPVFGSR